jgi:probable phosphoglycerate mutase
VDNPVYLVRHGQSEWNLLRLTQGQTMHPRLTDLGRAQARSAAEMIVEDLAGVPCLRIVSSDLARAAETAEVIDATLADAQTEPATITYDKRLREHALGALEGQPYEEGWSMADHPDWLDPQVRVGGGETVQEVYERIGSLLAETTGPIILVSHGDTIRAAYAWLRGLPVTEGSGVHITNGAVLRADALRWLQPRT